MQEQHPAAIKPDNTKTRYYRAIDLFSCSVYNRRDATSYLSARYRGPGPPVRRQEREETCMQQQRRGHTSHCSIQLPMLTAKLIAMLTAMLP